RAQSADLHLFRELVGIVSGLRSVNRAALAPNRRTDRADASAAGAFLLPQLLARTADFTATLGLVRAGAAASHVVAHRLIEKRFGDFGGEHRVSHFNRTDLLVVEIEDVQLRHDYCF